MRVRPRNVMFGLMAVAWGVALAWTFWSGTRPTGSLTQAAALAQAGRFDESESLAREHLRARPDSSEAHMLLAQIALDRPEPEGSKARRPDPRAAIAALKHLERVRPDTSYLAALVRLVRGKAEYRLARMEEAEASWIEALRIDAKIPEAAWCLLELYYLEGRGELARSLALRMHRNEPDPRDRAQFLLELLRQDAQPPAPGSIVEWFGPVLELNPDDFHTNLAMGQNLVREGQVDRGLAILERMTREHPDHLDAWDAWLTALDESGQTDLLLKAIESLPGPVSASHRFVRHHARAAQESSQWQAAVDGYRRSLREFPDDPKTKYRLARALRNSGANAEAEVLEKEHRTYQAGLKEARALYEEANAEKTLGVAPHPELCQRIAAVRERMGLKEEALAWHRMVLSAQPDNITSLEAVRRLEGS